jgi:hypothetical protein
MGSKIVGAGTTKRRAINQWAMFFNFVAPLQILSLSREILWFEDNGELYEINPAFVCAWSRTILLSPA